ncbi:signal transduction protein with nacht domain protein [Leptolyngbya sp. Heron Island J]|uniref:protein kinase domain-containing protein n=1 Tax=Leptolyngbya sp. Heron Island J TaxID=1385935 RepID=UPI0003B9A97A|nr:protein kinase [Leptolyngbya sp. Heron Island J]ESA38772.1 signal transduction protein with nacht domain protein [Leptolyngbya sp. Heron Island J]
MGQLLAHRYRIEKFMGQGGFGKVFLAHDQQLPGSPLCVVKQLNPIHTEALETATRLFNLEAETLYRLGEHPQIPRLLAHIEEAGELYLVQEYIPGQSLADEFRTSRLSVDQAIAFLQDLLTVLAAVHSQQVIHRDIKPSNILRRQGTGQLVLIDFGAVKALQAAPSGDLTVAIGSLGYMAPEQQAARPCFGSDLYSLGMVVLQGLSGRHPMGFEMPVTCAGVGVRVPGWLAGVIDRLVCLDHRERFGTAAAALRALCGREGESGRSTQATMLLGDASGGKLGAGALGFRSSTQPTVPSASGYSQQADRNRQALLNKVRRFWIEGVLDRSLHGQVLLHLGLEERPDAIAPPWQITYGTPGQSPQPLPAGTQVSHVFEAIGEGRTLLILGEPGAGKTTTLLSLTRQLLERPSQRLPVIFNLSSWLNGPIEPWLVKELNSKYQVPKAIGRRWVDEQQLLLLLDGLDEVGFGRRAACVAALNQFHQDYGPEMVVCCRIRDYEILPHKLQFQAALYLRPLTDKQILTYLNRPDQGLTGLKSLLEQNAAVQDTTTSLRSLARSPLILNIMVLTYQGVSSAEILRLGQHQDYRDYQHQLFDAYIQRMLERRPPGAYRPEQIKGWLRSLAQRLVMTSQTVFLIERIQPDWLQPGLRWVYVAGLWCSFFAIAILLGAQVLAPDRLLLAVVLGGLICSRIFGVSRITPAETLRWSWRQARNNLLLGLTLGPPIGWSLKVGFGFIFGDGPCLLNGTCLANHSLIGLAFGATLGLTFGLIRGLSGKQVGNTSRPNAGIWQSVRNSTLFALVSMVTLYVPGFLLGNTKASFWAATGLAFGFAAGGGEALIKHTLLRMMLTMSGATPWNYSKFLDYAVASIFLQKVGGGYMFVHRLLLEHFAAQGKENDPSLTRVAKASTVLGSTDKKT